MLLEPLSHLLRLHHLLLSWVMFIILIRSMKSIVTISLLVLPMCSSRSLRLLPHHSRSLHYHLLLQLHQKVDSPRAHLQHQLTSEFDCRSYLPRIIIDYSSVAIVGLLLHYHRNHHQCPRLRHPALKNYFLPFCCNYELLVIKQVQVRVPLFIK